VDGSLPGRPLRGSTKAEQGNRVSGLLEKKKLWGVGRGSAFGIGEKKRERKTRGRPGWGAMAKQKRKGKNTLGVHHGVDSKMAGRWENGNWGRVF